MTKAGKVTHTKAQGDSLTMSWQKGYLVYQTRAWVMCLMMLQGTVKFRLT